MFDWWFNLPRPLRLVICVGMIGLSAVWANYITQHRWHYHYRNVYDGPLLLFGVGLALLVVDLVFSDRYLNPNPENEERDHPAQLWVNIPPSQRDAVFSALAHALGGAFSAEKIHLLAAAAHLQAGETKEFTLRVRFDGVETAVRLRLIGATEGLTGCGFFAPPQLLTRIKSELAAIMDRSRVVSSD